MVKEDYVSYEVAKLLKEKGFEGDILMFIDKDNVKYDYTLSGFISDETIPCPTHQMAMKWLREKYHLHIWIDYSRLDCDEKQPYLWNIVETKIDGNYWGGTNHKKYEEAAELAIKYTLENLI